MIRELVTAADPTDNLIAHLHMLVCKQGWVEKCVHQYVIHSLLV